jgi:hypothetical protein
VKARRRVKTVASTLSPLFSGAKSMPYFETLKKHYSGLRKIPERFALVVSLRRFLRERITVEQAQQNIKRALDRREENFLELVRTHIYERPASPYLKLLKIAGCDFSDLRARVRRRGIEATLERLAAEGVYLTANEFKGKKPVVRGRESFGVGPAEFERLHHSAGFATLSSGTRNHPIRSGFFLDWLAMKAWATCIFFSAHDLFSHAHAMYDAILPGSGGINNLLIYAKLGISTDRWFARKIPVNTRLEAEYHYLMTRLIVLMGKRFGPGFPKPEFTDISQVYRIVNWASEKRREGKPCSVTTTASNAVRIARSAREMGESLAGVKFNVSGEPLTDAKRHVMEAVGATVTSRFSYGGSMNVGHGCGNPAHTGEIHVNEHMLALIQHPRPLADDGAPIHPLLCTTLNASASRLLLNVDNGDYATLEQRHCGCALEKAGLTLHLHHIRSYEKFTSEGMNYFYGDLFEFLEKKIPSEFGGDPGDYQLVEEEDENGQTRLTLVIHPAVEKLDEERLLARLRSAFSDGSWGKRFTTGVWENAGTFRVRREVPHASPRGKILPLHIAGTKK